MSKRRRNGPRPAGVGFWGSEQETAAPGGAGGGTADQRQDAPIPRILPTPDPSALPRSLGDPPLQVRPGVAEAHLAAVYEEAVRAATALAAANGLLAAGSGDADDA